MRTPPLKNTHFTNPKLWSRRNKIIAIVVAAILALTGITAFGVTSHIQHKKECQARSVAFTEKLTQLDQSTTKAHDALATVDESVKEGEGARLPHTQGFTLAPEGQSATAELNDAIAKADEAKTSEAAKTHAEEGKCLSAQDVTDAEAAVKAVDDKTQSFVGARDAYRLDKASKEAYSAMDTAKDNLAGAQQDADQQLAVVDNDSQMQADGNVKAAYDALKNVNNESHSISTTVNADSYDEAVASIEKAKAADQKAKDIENARQSLTNAIEAYHKAQAAQVAASSRSAGQSVSSNSGSRSYSSTPARSYGSTGGSQSRSYSNDGGSSSGSTSNQTQSKTGDESWRKYVKRGSEIKPGMHCYTVDKDQYICS